jgi:hypothetical protein
MYSDTDLESAVAAGVISPDQVSALRQHIAGLRATPAVDEEHFRLLTGFNDIFVGIAAVILLVAVAWIGNAIPPEAGIGGPSPWMGVALAATAWGLAEFFTRKRRMALPSIILLLAFLGGVILATGLSLVVAIGESRLNNDQGLTASIVSASGAAGALAAWLHWRRFKVPITVAAGAAALVGLGLGLLGIILADTEGAGNLTLGFALLLGAGVFLFAMWWDGADPRRETRRSDVAFWLHLLAAPLIVHPIFTLLGLNDGDATAAEALVVLLVYLILGLTALAVDRRALLVSALVYVLYALNSMFRSYGAVELSVALTALVIGSALLLLSAFWHHARRGVVRPLPAGLQARLPVLDRVVAA